MLVWYQIVAAFTDGAPDKPSMSAAAVLQMMPQGSEFDFEVCLDVNETTALVWDAKKNGKGTACVVFGGGSPKNFILQTEPQIQEILGMDDVGHNFYIQFTDARPDTGGLSGATPGEAVTWGKIDPERLPDTVVCYTDSTIAMPIFAGYVLTKCEPREPSRLYRRRGEMLEQMRRDYHAFIKVKPRRTDWPEGRPAALDR